MKWRRRQVRYEDAPGKEVTSEWSRDHMVSLETRRLQTIPSISNRAKTQWQLFRVFDHAPEEVRLFLRVCFGLDEDTSYFCQHRRSLQIAKARCKWKVCTTACWWSSNEEKVAVDDQRCIILKECGQSWRRCQSWWLGSALFFPVQPLVYEVCFKNSIKCGLQQHWVRV